MKKIKKSQDLRSVETLGSPSYGNKRIIPDTVFILKNVRQRAVDAQDLAETIRYINDYIEVIERSKE